MIKVSQNNIFINNIYYGLKTCKECSREYSDTDAVILSFNRVTGRFTATVISKTNATNKISHKKIKTLIV